MLTVRQFKKMLTLLVCTCAKSGFFIIATPIVLDKDSEQKQFRSEHFCIKP